MCYTIKVHQSAVLICLVSTTWVRIRQFRIQIQRNLRPTLSYVSTVTTSEIQLQLHCKFSQFNKIRLELLKKRESAERGLLISRLFKQPVP